MSLISMIISHYFYNMTHFRCKGRNKEIFSFVFWFKWRHPKVIMKLTDLYYSQLYGMIITCPWETDIMIKSKGLRVFYIPISNPRITWNYFFIVDSSKRKVKKTIRVNLRQQEVFIFLMVQIFHLVLVFAFQHPCLYLRPFK